MRNVLKKRDRMAATASASSGERFGECCAAYTAATATGAAGVVSAADVADVCCTFDISAYFFEQETGCCVRSVRDARKVMRSFATSRDMLDFMKAKRFEYDAKSCLFKKNGNVYAVWCTLRA